MKEKRRSPERGNMFTCIIIVMVTILAIIFFSAVKTDCSGREIIEEETGYSEANKNVSNTITTNSTRSLSSEKNDFTSSTSKKEDTTLEKKTNKGTTKITTERSRTENYTSEMIYSASYFRNAGVIYWGGYKWTWYSQRVLPGGGLQIPGRHVDSNGYVCDGNDYICLASTSMPKGTITNTPFGKMGKVYDTGCDYGVYDVYCNW